MRKSVLTVLAIFVMLLSFTACTKEDQVKSPVYGKWASVRGAMFDFNEEGRYGWYKEKDNTTDNYYKGSLKLLRGEEALEDLGITKEEYNRAYKEYTGNVDNVFSVKMYFEILHSEGIDKSDTLNKEDYYYYAFIISGENEDEATAINVSDVMVFKVTRVKSEGIK